MASSLFKEYPALLVKQVGASSYTISMKVADLHRHTHVDWHDPALPDDSPKNGYQRKPTPGRPSYARYLQMRAGQGLLIIPNAIIVNCRGSGIRFDPKTRMLRIDTEAKLWIIDGQHRDRGWQELLKSDELPEWIADFDIQVTMLSVSKETEMDLFIDINGNAKSVSTDLALRIATGKKKNDSVYDTDEKRKVPKMVGSMVADILRTDSKSVWFEQIAGANEPNPKRFPIKSNAMLDSVTQLYSVLESGLHFGPAESIKDRATILAAIVSNFWRAVYNVIGPDPFSEGGHNRYSLTTTIGVFSMNYFLAQIFREAYARAMRESRETDPVKVLTPEAFEPFIRLIPANAADHWSKEDENDNALKQIRTASGKGGAMQLAREFYREVNRQMALQPA